MSIHQYWRRCDWRVLSMLGRRSRSAILTVPFVLCHVAWAQSNVDPVNKYAWNEDSGWTNWRDAGSGADGVVVGAAFLSGFIWGEDVGWINVGNGAGPYSNADGGDSGVNVAVGGDLGGYAWAENFGWVNFGWATPVDPNRPRLDVAADRLRGWAWGENIGWINLDDARSFVGVADTGPAIPVATEWGGVVSTLMLVACATIVFHRRAAHA